MSWLCRKIFHLQQIGEHRLPGREHPFGKGTLLVKTQIGTDQSLAVRKIDRIDRQFVGSQRRKDQGRIIVVNDVPQAGRNRRKELFQAKVVDQRVGEI